MLSAFRHAIKAFAPRTAVQALLLAFLACTTPSILADTITIHSRDDATARYALNIFEMAMNKAQAPYTLNIQKSKKSAITLRRMLEAGKTDVIWATTSQALEDKFIAVRIPLYKGLMGYRTLLIQSGSQPIFDDINNLTDLQKVSLGQVHSWADTTILEKNGLNIVKVTKHKSLFNKLKKGDFDAAPRAIHETIQEAQVYDGFAAEQRLLLHYPQPMYLFVSAHKPELAHQLIYGLSKAVRDGSLDVLLYRESNVKQAIQELKRNKRTLIELANPDLPSKTPLGNKQLWLSL